MKSQSITVRGLVSCVILACIWIALGANVLVAQTGSDCAQLAEPDARLSCYDELFVVREPVVIEGFWSVRDTRSALDDSRRVILSVQSVEKVRGRFGQEDYASLLLRCEENTTSLFINWGGHFMSDLNGGGRVDYRIDDQPPSHIIMGNSNNNMALGLWNGRQSIPFIQRLPDGGQLYVRATPFSESRIEARFNIAGLSEAIAPLREACNW